MARHHAVNESLASGVNECLVERFVVVEEPKGRVRTDLVYDAPVKQSVETESGYRSQAVIANKILSSHDRISLYEHHLLEMACRICPSSEKRRCIAVVTLEGLKGIHEGEILSGKLGMEMSINASARN